MTTDSNALTTIIRDEIIQQGGVISFARFMTLALYHPRYGYYNAKHFDIGKSGDFTTASEISPLFAQCFAAQSQQIMAHTGFQDLLELGAGTGRFAGELMLALDRLASPCSHYYVIEISSHLRSKQQHTLKTDYPTVFDRVIWLDKLPENFKGIMIGNEILDALPVHCFHIEKTAIKEKNVTWEHNQFNWKNDIAPQSLASKVKKLQENYSLPDGYESEINLELPHFIQSITNAMSEGIILFSDYGYGQAEYYRPERNHGTLTCFYQHKRHDNPFAKPGYQDITAHVDFTHVAEAAVEQGCQLAGYTTQAMFLLNCGLLKLAQQFEENFSEAEKFNSHHAIKILTMPTEMGERVKVVALSKNVELELLGFSASDRRREL